jgi:hypothetical protein
MGGSAIIDHSIDRRCSTGVLSSNNIVGGTENAKSMSQMWWDNDESSRYRCTAYKWRTYMGMGMFVLRI